MSRHRSTTVTPGTVQRRETGERVREMKIDRGRIGCLIREEVSRKSLSYVATAVAAVFFGLLITPSFSSAVIPLSESARSGGFFSVDLLLLMIMSIVSINVFSKDYTLIHRDPFHGWLVFLRSLPVSSREMVLARSLIMLPATVVMTALFFAPVFVVSWALMEEFPAGQFLWFGLFWLGYALLAGGINLYMELGVRGKVAFGLQFVWLLLLIAIVWLTGGNLIFTTFELAGSYGPLPAGLALLAGGALFAVFAKATEHRVGGRDLAA
jgi:hypothetical protein